MKVKSLAPYAKTVVAVGGIVVMLGKALLDGAITGDEAVQIGTAVLVALGVYAKPNKQVA